MEDLSMKSTLTHEEAVNVIHERHSFSDNDENDARESVHLTILHNKYHLVSSLITGNTNISKHQNLSVISSLYVMLLHCFFSHF